MLIRIAILEKRNDDAVKLYGTLVKQNKLTGGIEQDIAEAVKKTHPDLALQIWESAARKLIATVKPRAYYEAAGYLRRMRDVYRKTKKINNLAASSEVCWFCKEWIVWSGFIPVTTKSSLRKRGARSKLRGIKPSPRIKEWNLMLGRLRIEHKAKRRLMDVLDELEDGEKALV